MTEKREGKSGWIIWVVGVLITLLILTIVIYYPDYITKKLDTWADRGAFGDSYGSVSALFSGLAFVALVLTLWLQKKELSLQREQLKRSVEAQEKSEQALAKQVEVLEKTAKLNALNTLANLYHEQLKQLKANILLPDKSGEIRKKWEESVREMESTLSALRN